MFDINIMFSVYVAISVYVAWNYISVINSMAPT